MIICSYERPRSLCNSAMTAVGVNAKFIRLVRSVHQPQIGNSPTSYALQCRSRVQTPRSSGTIIRASLISPGSTLGNLAPVLSRYKGPIPEDAHDSHRLLPHAKVCPLDTLKCTRWVQPAQIQMAVSLMKSTMNVASRRSAILAPLRGLT